MITPPIKRSLALQSLSREHHHGLLLCWKIRTGFKKAIELERIKAYTDWVFKNDLLPHFQIEEEFVFPILGNANDLVRKAMSQHRKLKRLFWDASDLNKSLNFIEEELERHIRFEERILFNEIEKVATDEQLDLLLQTHSKNIVYENWIDEFWK